MKIQEINSIELHFKLCILFVIIKIVTSIDYCELEKLCSNNKKHIGCEKNIFNKIEKPFIQQNLTNTVRQGILDYLNTFRNNIATGVYQESNDFPKASNMRSIRWNYEFEYLCGLSIKKLPYADFDGCHMTENFTDPWELHCSLNGNLDYETVFRETFKTFIDEMFKNKTNFSRLYKAEIYQIGCAFGKESMTNLVKCYMNSKGVLLSLEESYIAGEPCTNCSMWNEICDKEKYLGLCVSKTNDTQLKEEMINSGDFTYLMGRKLGSPDLMNPKNVTDLKMDREDTTLSGNKQMPISKQRSMGRIDMPTINSVQSLMNETCHCEEYIKLILADSTHITPTICEYPFSFWILYSIVIIGILLSITLSIIFARNGYKKLNELNWNKQEHLLENFNR